MYIEISPEQFSQSPELQQLALFFIMNGGGTRWGYGKTSYMIDAIGQQYLERSHVDLLIANTCKIDAMSMYSPIIPKSTLDNKVPSTWPKAMKVLEDGSEVTKEWQEYTRVLEVDGGYVLEYTSGGKDKNDNVRGPLSNEMMLLWISEFGGYLLKSEVPFIVEEQV